MKAPCKRPGCPNLVNRSGYCPTHAHHAKRLRNREGESRYITSLKDNAPELMESRRLRSSTRWQRVRRMKLGRDPLCEDPFGDHARQGITVGASQVHHIEGVSKRPDLAFDLTNLMSICTKCHARIESHERTKNESGPCVPSP